MQVQSLPIHALIGHRERLGLTSEQITALDSIGIWLQSANGPAMAELRTMMGAGRGAMGAMRSGAGRPNEEALPIIERIGENNRTAVAGVKQVLSEDQQAQVCELFEPRPGAGPVMRSAGGGGGGGGGGRMVRRSGGGSPGSISPRAAWEWCAPSPDAEPRESTEIRRD